MAQVPMTEIVRSAAFRRAALPLFLVWLVATVGAVLLLDRLSGQVRGGWELRGHVVEWVDDAEGEICFRRGSAGLEVLSGGSARLIADSEVVETNVDGLGPSSIDSGSDASGSDFEESDFEETDLDGADVEGDFRGSGLDEDDFEGGAAESAFAADERDAEGFEIESESFGEGEWICVTREALLDDSMEALMRSAFELSPPDRLYGPIWLGGVAWVLIGAGLIFFGAFRLAEGPVALALDLERVREQVAAGDHASRLRRRGGELDAAVSDINAILDRLEYTITTLSEVTDHIAHDLRTPLTRLQGQLDLVRRSEQPTPAMIDSMQEEANQLLSTFNALLRIAHVKGGSRRKGFRAFDLAAVARDAAELYGPAMEEKPLSFAALLPDHPIEAFGDAELCMQMISNLLDNAFKYTPENKHVELEVRIASAESVQIRISDSGHGIPEGEQHKVLERFYRLSSHRRQRGSGLGLSLVAAICELHGARLELVNRDGLTVLVDLPREGS